jgi:hypothetical protein
MALLKKKQFPHFGGLKDPVVGSKLQSSISTGQFVEVVHTQGTTTGSPFPMWKDYLGTIVSPSIIPEASSLPWKSTCR